MSAKTLGITNKAILGLCLAVMLFSNLVIALDFELTYQDPEGDVEDFEGHI